MNRRRKAPVAPYALVPPAFCPSAETAKNGFIAFNDSRVHEVYHLNDGRTRQVTHFPDGAKQESIYFAGLVGLENRPVGIAHVPRSDLSPLLALTVGASHRISLDVSYTDQPPAVEHIQLTVEKKKVQKVGPCQYEVLEIEHRMAFDNQDMQFTHVAVYSPVLRYVVAMRFAKHGTVTAAPQLAPVELLDRLLAYIRKTHAQTPSFWWNGRAANAASRRALPARPAVHQSARCIMRIYVLFLALLSATAVSFAQPESFPRPLPIEKAPVLPAHLAKGIGQIKSTADKLVVQKRYEEAIKEYWRAFDLLPKPQKDWRETTLLLAAIGEANFLVGNYEACRDNLSTAMHSPGAIGTPSIHLRLGACQFELGDRRRAADELARAYIPGGTSVFRAGDQKYLDYIKTQLNPPPGGWPKGW